MAIHGLSDGLLNGPLDGSHRVFVKICNNRELFQSNRDQNGGIAAISCHVVASGCRCGRGQPPPTGGVWGASPGKILKF